MLRVRAAVERRSPAARARPGRLTAPTARRSGRGSSSRPGSRPGRRGRGPAPPAPARPRQPAVELVHQLLGVVVVHRVGGGDDRRRAAAHDDRGRRDDAGADVARGGRGLAGRQDDAARAHRLRHQRRVRQRAAGQLDPRQQRVVAAPAGVGRDVDDPPPAERGERAGGRRRVASCSTVGRRSGRRCAAPRWRRSAGRARRSRWRSPSAAAPDRPCRRPRRGSRCACRGAGSAAHGTNASRGAAVSRSGSPGRRGRLGEQQRAERRRGIARAGAVGA